MAGATALLDSRHGAVMPCLRGGVEAGAEIDGSDDGDVAMKVRATDGAGAFLTGCPQGTLLTGNAPRQAGAQRPHIPHRDAAFRPCKGGDPTLVLWPSVPTSRLVRGR